MTPHRRLNPLTGRHVLVSPQRALRPWQGAAEATAPLSPRLGRARPLAARSVGTPDAGATSFALAVRAMAPVVADTRAGGR